MHKFNEILVNVSELLPFEHLSQVIWQWTCSSTQTCQRYHSDFQCYFVFLLS